MPTLALALFALVLPGWIPAGTLDVVGEMKALYQAHRDAGQTEESRRAIDAFWEAHDAEHAEDAAYLLQKSEILGWLDDYDAADRVFDQVPDAALEKPHHLLNRLRACCEDDPARARPLMLRLAEARPSSFATWLHDSYAQRFVDGRVAATELDPQLALLDELRASDTPAAEAVPGLQAYLLALASKDSPDALRAILERPTGGTLARGDRYALMLVGLAVELPELADAARERLDRLMAELAERRARAATGAADDARVRARERYYLAQAAYLHARHLCADDDSRAAWLVRATGWDPDAADVQVRQAYFYEAAMIGGELEVTSSCARELEALGRLGEAREAWLRLAEVYPDRLGEARAAFARIAPEVDFDALWLDRLTADLPPVPDFELTTPGGELVRLSDLRGSWVLLDFWGTWCGPCRKELPDLDALYRRTVGRDGATVLTVACNDTPEAVTEFMAERGYAFPVVMGDEQVIRDFDVQGYPTKVLVTPDGRWKKLAYGVGDWRVIARRHLLGE